MNRYVALVDGDAGAYGVVLPDLNGCTAMGATIEEALANAREAVREWAEVMEEQGHAIPNPRPIEAVRKDSDTAAALSEGAVLAFVPLLRVREDSLIA